MAEVLKHHKARKRFGQNFLNDDFWINKIAEAVDPKEGQKIIEIGPGQALSLIHISEPTRPY